MISVRFAWWVLGLALVGVCTTGSADDLRSYAAVGWPPPLAGVVAAALLVTGSMAARRATAVALWALGATWLVPDLAVAAHGPSHFATLAEAWFWVLVALGAVVVLRATGTPVPRSPAAALIGAGCAVGWAARVLLVDPLRRLDCWRTCSANAWARPGASSWVTVLDAIAVLLVIAGLVVAGVALAALRRGTPNGPDPGPDRRLAGAAGVTTVALLGLALPAAAPGQPWATVLAWTATLGGAVLGGGLIVRGVLDLALRRRLTRLAVDLAATADPDGLVDELRAAVDDPHAQVRYWAPNRSGYVDAHGRPVLAADVGPEPAGSLGTTTITRSGRRLAQVVHSREATARLAPALGPALRLGLENAQLRAAMLAELDDIAASQSRILEASHEERRRLERNLHDGAQQRVVSLVLLLRIIASRTTSEATARTARLAAEQTTALLDELRHIARGIHPAIVTDAGLAGALEALAEGSTELPVTVAAGSAGALTPVAEATAYEFVSTALSDAAGCGATQASVSSRDEAGAVVVEVVHDAERPPASSVLDGVAAQAEALAGRLAVEGRAGRWRLRMEVPCVS